eukprot:14920808-Ditylum_brightwellii.AAC.1
MEYYEMFCVYVDDIVAVSSKTRDAIQQITEVFTAKEGSVGVPERYLGADIEKIQAVDGRMVWSTSLRSYIKNAIQEVEDLFMEDGFDGGLKRKVKNPFPSGYKPELGVTDEVGDHLFSRYCSGNGAHGTVLGKSKSRPSSHPDMGRLAYDPKEPMVDESIFKENANWTDFYGDVEEELSPRMPDPRGCR